MMDEAEFGEAGRNMAEDRDSERLEFVYMGNGVVRWVRARPREEWEELRLRSREREDEAVRHDAISGLLKKDCLEVWYLEMLEGAIDPPDCLRRYRAYKNQLYELMRKDDISRIEEYAEYCKAVQGIIDKIAVHMSVTAGTAPKANTPEPSTGTPAPNGVTVPELTDSDCLKRLEDTGFIAGIGHEKMKGMGLYEKTRAVNVGKIYDELLRITGDGERARRIMLNSISGTEAGLKKYLQRIANRDKSGQIGKISSQKPIG